MPLTGKRILLVEDEYLIAMMAADMLQGMGAEIIGPVGTVDEGIELSRDNEIDAAVLDVHLRDGLSDRLAAYLEEKNVPYVFATGRGLGGEQKHDAPVVKKPYSEHGLQTAIVALLSKD